jgi:hypothetical protein
MAGLRVAKAATAASRMDALATIQVAPDSAQAAFLRRAISALERISATVPTKALADALAAPTDAGSLAAISGSSMWA